MFYSTKPKKKKKTPQKNFSAAHTHHNCPASFNYSYTLMTEPVKPIELHHTVIHFFSNYYLGISLIHGLSSFRSHANISRSENSSAITEVHQTAYKPFLSQQNLCGATRCFHITGFCIFALVCMTTSVRSSEKSREQCKNFIMFLVAS